ncbi:MAG TPA: ATP-binding protein [Candidatus Dormibacteraeota bacterium]|nr:ATP-binding protein [Candidatus Dormibacteraeota bacterium]
MATQFNHPKKRAAHGDMSTLHLRVPPDPRYARTVRDAIVGFAGIHEIRDEDLESLLFAVGEALANAIEHAASQDDIEVLCEVDRERIVATVIDRGKGYRRVPTGIVPLPADLSERGRGIPIMQRCTDFFDVLSLPDRGTAVRLGRFRRTSETSGP